MSALAQKREEARKVYADMVAANEAGDIQKFLGLDADMKRLTDELAALEQAQNRVEILKGDFNRPTNDIPLSSKERETYDPNDTGSKYQRDYRPAGWVKGLSAAIQPKWVREKMGDALKQEERFYIDTWTKWFRCRNGEAVKHFMASMSAEERKAMQENTDNEGGYFVPEEYRTQVIHDPGAPGGVIRPYCSVGTTSLKDGYWPTLGSVTWAAIAEEAAYGDNTPTIGQVSYTVRKSGGTVKVSNELLEDSMANLPALLYQIFNEAKGRYEDQQVIEGDGTTEPEGLRTASITDVTTAGATALIAADVLKFYWALPAQFRGGATWYTTSTWMQQLMSIGATAAGIHFGGGADNVDLTKAPVGTLLGRPIALFDGTGWDDSTALASGEETGAFGNFANYYLIDRIGMSLRRDDSIYVANDQVGFFARCRFDGRVGLTSAFRIMKQA